MFARRRRHSTTSPSFPGEHIACLALFVASALLPPGGPYGGRGGGGGGGSALLVVAAHEQSEGGSRRTLLQVSNASLLGSTESSPSSSSSSSSGSTQHRHLFSSAASTTERVSPDPKLAANAKDIWGDTPVLWAITGNYEPYEYVTGYNDIDENGELLPPDTPTGFAVEMIVRTCDLCGLRCEWVLEDTQVRSGEDQTVLILYSHLIPFLTHARSALFVIIVVLVNVYRFI